MLKRLIPVVLIGFLLSGCAKDEMVSNSDVHVNSMRDLKVDPSFMFNTTQNVNLDFSTVLNGFSSSEKFLFTVYDKDPKLGGRQMVKGMANTNLNFRQTIPVPTANKSVYVVMRSSFGRTEIKEVEIQGGRASATFNNASIHNAPLRTQSGPDCTSGCNSSVSNGATSITVSGGNTVCVPAGVSVVATVTFSSGGGTLRVCGSLQATNINQNNNCDMRIIVTSSGSFNTANLTMNGEDDLIENYSNNFLVTNNFIAMGTVNNYGNLVVNHQCNVNGNGVINNKTNALFMSEDLNNNDTVINNGTVVQSGSFHNNGGNYFLNNCAHYVTDDFHQNETYVNNGFVSVGAQTTYSGSSNTYYGAGSLFFTKDIQLNGDIHGNSSVLSRLKVSNITRITGGAHVHGKVDICDADGFEVNNGSLDGSVTTNCTGTIPAAGCVPGDGTVVADTDGDGVDDNNDDYPNDPNKAFDNYYPGKGVYGNIAFEDNWPNYGDYDLNDLVMAYNYHTITNAQNKVVEVNGGFKVRAFGAQKNNGFGVSFPVNPSSIGSITGTLRGRNIINDNAKGYENGHGTSNTVIIVFDAINTIYGTQMANTLTGGASVNTDTAFVRITFSTPQTSIGTFPFNQFLIANGDRGKEVHLKGYAPTALADQGYFGYADDRSTNGNWYKDAAGLPWAIDIPELFAYPKEYKDITTAYLKFATWAQSNGTQYADWYRNLSGYRNAANIY